MEQLAITIMFTSAILGIVALLLLQFSPAKYTLTKAAHVVVNKNVRPALWGLPIHMFSTYGKSLKVAFYACTSVCVLIAIAGYLYAQILHVNT